jgi:hypothetical protein
MALRPAPMSDSVKICGCRPMMVAPRTPAGRRTQTCTEADIRAQNWNGSTETEILPSDCWTVKFTSFEAFVSPTVADIEPLHLNVRLSALVEVVTIVSPRRYSGFSKFDDFSACEVGVLDFSLTTLEFLAAKVASGFPWSSETI